MTADELRAAMLREKFRGHDPNQVDAAIDRWTAAVERGEKLDVADLTGQTFRQKLRGYHPGDV